MAFLHRLSAPLLISLLCACVPTEENSCTSDIGTVHGQLYGMEGEVPYVATTSIVTVTDTMGDSLEVIINEGGTYEVELPAGLYELEAADEVGGCFTESSTEITVGACGNHELNLSLDLCWGR